MLTKIREAEGDKRGKERQVVEMVAVKEEGRGKS